MAKKAAKSDAEAQSDGVVALARGLAEVVTDHQLTELVLETGGTTIKVRREATVAALPMQMPVQMPVQVPMPAAGTEPTGAPQLPPSSTAGQAPAAAVEDKSHVVTSPFVGTFYRKPNPDSQPYVALNDRVEKGQVLCIVEAMKLMNEIEADVAGTIIGILVEDGAPVEYGQALFRIAP